MKKKYLYFSVMLAVIFFVSYICVKIYFEKNFFRLENGYVWKKTSYNDTVIIDYEQRVIIGPGCITLWAQYPWLYGDIVSNQQSSYWAVNMETGKRMYMNNSEFADFKNKNNITASMNRTVTFMDVAKWHQWQSQQRTRELKQLLKKP